MRAVAVSLIASVAVIVLALAIWRLMPATKPIEIGLIGTLTGRFSPLGVAGRDGAMLAVEQLNAAGGIAGHRIELHIADDGGQAGAATEALHEMSQTGMQAVIGPVTSASAAAIKSIAHADQIVVVSGTASGQQLAHSEDYLIRLFPSTAQYGERMSTLIPLASMHQITTISDTNAAAYAETILDAFTDTCQATNPTLTFHNIPFTSGFETNYQALASMVLDTQPDAIFIITGTLDCALLLQFIRQKDPEVTVLTSPWAISNELVHHSGDAINGLLFALPYRLDDHSPAYLQFVADYHTRFGRAPDHVSLMHYECVQLLHTIWQENPRLSKADLLQAIVQRSRFQGLQQTYAIDRYGDADWPLYPHTYHDGQIQALP